MLEEVKEHFTPTMIAAKNEGTFSMVDATIGFGGHTEALLTLYKNLLEETSSSEHSSAEQMTLGELSVDVLDADRHMLDSARRRLSAFGDSVHYHETFFDDFFLTAKENTYDLILMDLGVSMYHFKESDRGFSRNYNAKLDMRLSDKSEITASDIINSYSLEELMQIFYDFGEERQAGKWARRIVEARKVKSIDTVFDLCEVLQLGKKSMDRPILTRIFQALRIAVNDELSRLHRALPLAWNCLKKHGRMGIISFHSLEDRIVKNFFRHCSGKLKNTEKQPIYSIALYDTAKILTKKPIIASEKELEENNASRSAKLRVSEKLV